jgi:hypothetical protein
MNVVRLKVLAPYQSRQTMYVKDSIIEVTEPEAEFLFRDAPGCFEVAVTPRVDEPPADEPPVDEPKFPDEGEGDKPPTGKAPRRPPADKMVKDGDTEIK